MFKKIAVAALMVAYASAAVVQLTEDNFDSIVMDANKNVFVKFFAPWCGHCTRMAPAWEELSNSVADDVVIAELNADDFRSKAQSHGIRGFPTIKYFSKTDKSGKNYQGARDVASFKDFLNANV